MGAWREVITRSSTHEPDKTGGNKYRGFYWAKGTKVTTVVLSCGHTKTYRGDDNGPKKRALCKECPETCQPSGETCQPYGAVLVSGLEFQTPRPSGVSIVGNGSSIRSTSLSAMRR